MTTSNMLKRLVENRLIKARVTQAQSKTVNKPVTAAIPVVDDPTLQTWIKTISREINNFAKSGVTRKDLIDYGVLGVGGNGDVHSLLTPQLEVDYTVPRAVVNLEANGAYSSITLTWETPQNKSFGYNAVYRSEVDDFGTAVQIGSSVGDIYTDYVGNGIKAYYWVRTISKFNVEGDLAPSVYAETSINIPYLLEQLASKITRGQLADSINAEFEKIKTIALDLQTEVNNRIALAEDTALKFLNLTNNTNASITNVQNILNSKIENVAQEVSLVSAGVGEQFDTHLIWFFDENDNTEGWTSTNGLPTVLNGWIRPFLSGADSDLISPEVTPFSGNMYPDIRFRVRKVGNPVWSGRIYWGQDFATYVDIEAPIWTDNNIGVVQKNIEWIGDISQIKLILSPFQDENNYFVLDWFSFGRPSPAASWAIVGELRTAIANENYARTEYQILNDARFASNDAEYRALINEAMTISADQNGIVSNKIDSIMLKLDTQYAGSEEHLAGSDLILVGYITEEEFRIEGDQALGRRIDTLSAQINDDIAASIQQESQVRASADEALAEQIFSMQAQLDNDIAAAILEESQVRATENEALASQVTALQAQVNDDITAAILEESIARTSADEALAGQITTLQAKVDDDIVAAMQQEAMLRASEDEALAGQITTLQTQINEDITAAIQTESNARADQDAALSSQITTLQTKFTNDIAAAVQVEAKARADADSAMSKTVTTVQTTVNGHTSSIQQNLTSINGLKAEWKIRVQSGGKVSGVSLGTNGTESQFLVLADRFAVGTSTSTSYPFIIDQGRVVMNTAIIKDASIANAKIGNISADKITAGNIAADRMRANIVAAVSGQFTSLSAITARIGVLRTATSGARTEIKDNLIEVYDANGRRRVRLGVW